MAHGTQRGPGNGRLSADFAEVCGGAAYNELLDGTPDPKAIMPERTYVIGDEKGRRREYELRRAATSRRWGRDHAVDDIDIGFRHFPTGAANWVAESISALPIGDFSQARSYITNDKLRAVILTAVLAEFPSEGEVVLIGHSLGSLVAIDLLDHLPPTVTVLRLITLGSPGGHDFVHENRERLYKQFPYGRVHDWSNVYASGDHVSLGRGLSRTFVAAQDFCISLGSLKHDAAHYLRHRFTANLVGEMMQGSLSRDVAVRNAELDVHASDTELATLFALAFAHHVREHIKDADRRARYGAALNSVQDDVAVRLGAHLSAEGRLVSGAVRKLVDRERPRLPRSWDLEDVLVPIVQVATMNLVQPYEVEVGDAPRLALRDMAIDLGFAQERGVTIAASLKEVADVLSSNSGLPWDAILLGAAGVALLAAGPLGIALAAPAGVAGAAALTGALAAFGPGGMVGGLIAAGGLVGAGATLTTTGVAQLAADAPFETVTADLLQRVGVARTRQVLKLPPDREVWF